MVCVYHSGQSWLMNTWPQNFVVLVHFWPKLMWTSSIKEVHRDMIFNQVWLMLIILAKADWWVSDHKIMLVLSISGQSWCGLDRWKKFKEAIKCDMYLLFWPKLINEYLFTKFCCSGLFLAKADVDQINKRSLWSGKDFHA